MSTIVVGVSFLGLVIINILIGIVCGLTGRNIDKSYSDSIVEIVNEETKNIFFYGIIFTVCYALKNNGYLPRLSVVVMCLIILTDIITIVTKVVGIIVLIDDLLKEARQNNEITSMVMVYIHNFMLTAVTALELVIMVYFAYISWN
ncbi:MAG: hypothetical protein PUD92_04150 [Clostridiales bacterium]|nr:hypothetical protein [Clostridiales bacterium]